MVIWITGLSGSGKTTLCKSIWNLLKHKLPELVLLDGDTIRAAFDDGLGYREEDRVIQITRMQNLAKLLSDQGLIVLVAALYSNPKLLDWNRNEIKDYYEIFLEASIESLTGRDTNNLYQRALEGSMSDVVGVDIPWHAPQAPDIVINTNDPENSEAMAERVIAAVPTLARVLARSLEEKAI